MSLQHLFPDGRAPTLTRRTALAGASGIGAAWLAGCATAVTPPTKPPSTIRLPVFLAWVDGRSVRYITTDASDRAFAARMGINHAPRLAAALQTAGQPARPQASLLERVYMFHGEVQINVFQSGPDPVGPDSRDAAYSPLWRAVMVRWLNGQHPRELRSEEDILAAQDRGWVVTEVTEIVINCPIVANA